MWWTMLHGSIIFLFLFCVSSAEGQCGPKHGTPPLWRCLLPEDEKNCCFYKMNYTEISRKAFYDHQNVTCPFLERNHTEEIFKSHDHAKIICCRAARCEEWIKEKIFGKNDGGSYFVNTNSAVDERLHLTFYAGLLSVDDLSYSGILKLTLDVRVTWDSDLGWDESLCRRYKTNG